LKSPDAAAGTRPEYSVAQRGEAKFVHRQELNEIKDNSA
jgi:hypothetical protein